MGSSFSSHWQQQLELLPRPYTSHFTLTYHHSPTIMEHCWDLCQYCNRVLHNQQENDQHEKLKTNIELEYAKGYVFLPPSAQVIACNNYYPVAFRLL